MNEFEKLLLKVKVNPAFENPLFPGALKELWKVSGELKILDQQTIIDTLTVNIDKLEQFGFDADSFRAQLPTFVSYVESMRKK